MMRPRILAEVGLALLGVYAITRTVEILLGSVARAWVKAYISGEGLSWVAILALPAVALVGLAWILIVRRRTLAERLFPAEETDEPSGLAAEVRWEAAGYRLVLVLAGVLLLTNVAALIAGHVAFLAGSRDLFASIQRSWSESASFVSQLTKLSHRSAFASAAVKGFLGLYFVLGAPRLSRWLAFRARKPDAPQPPTEPAA